MVYPSNFTHGEESDLGNGNHFVNEDSTICLNVYATYFDVFKDDYSLREWFDMMIDTEVEQGNIIVKKDITDHSYIIEGNNSEIEVYRFKKKRGREAFTKYTQICLNK